MRIEYAEIAVAAIEATTRPERWGALCDVIAKQLGAQAFMLQEYNIADHSTPIFHASRYMRTGDGRQILEKVVVGHEDTAVERAGYGALSRVASGTVLGEAEAFGFDPSGPPLTNPIRDRVLAATGSKSRSALRLNQLGPWMDVAITCDIQSDYSASKQLIKYAPALSAILQKAIESKRLIDRLTESYNVLLNLFDHFSFGIAFCDQNGGIIAANEKLRHWLGEKDALVKVRNKIEAAVDADKSTLRATLAKSSNTGLSAKATTLSLRRRSGATPLVVHIAPIKDAKVRRGGAYLVFALDPAEQRQVTADGLAAIGTLTRAELEICDLLLQGLSTASVSDQRGTGLETVRGQIKSIMQKLECKQRLDLVRLAMVTSPKLYFSDKS